MLDEALGENRAYFRQHGYHADILRESILETLPLGWREKLVPVAGCPTSFALKAHDLAAIKLLVGRPKDLVLLEHLHACGLLNVTQVRSRIAALDIPKERLPRLLSHFKHIFGASEFDR